MDDAARAPEVSSCELAFYCCAGRAKPYSPAQLDVVRRIEQLLDHPHRRDTT
jgi:hypothetical protein